MPPTKRRAMTPIVDDEETAIQQADTMLPTKRRAVTPIVDDEETAIQQAYSTRQGRSKSYRDADLYPASTPEP
jgi:hypothetical protein